MNPLILIGFDLVFSAVLILLVLHLTWGRLRTVLEAQGMVLGDGPAREASEKLEGAEKPMPTDLETNVEVGNMTNRAETLRRQGLSVEEIASRLQSPRGEIEMILALSEMGRSGEPEEPGPVIPPPKRKITEFFRF